MKRKIVFLLLLVLVYSHSYCQLKSLDECVDKVKYPFFDLKYFENDCTSTTGSWQDGFEKPCSREEQSHIVFIAYDSDDDQWAQGIKTQLIDCKCGYFPYTYLEDKKQIDPCETGYYFANAEYVIYVDRESTRNSSSVCWEKENLMRLNKNQSN